MPLLSSRDPRTKHYATDPSYAIKVKNLSKDSLRDRGKRIPRILLAKHATSGSHGMVILAPRPDSVTSDDPTPPKQFGPLVRPIMGVLTGIERNHPHLQMVDQHPINGQDRFSFGLGSVFLPHSCLPWCHLLFSTGTEDSRRHRLADKEFRPDWKSRILFWEVEYSTHLRQMQKLFKSN
ncbi:hypothetical protein F511_08224 [Dorcoceras hygrometricum]|uniref:Uncharacterized protein n=1 Tax=Dorcoceras hygrometricum TaxID=472368 RepID=A0A2Z7BYN9_9LAMI|nr:hypothetical protein F511_08224 [Dorcoceras hygrometricum]